MLLEIMVDIRAFTIILVLSMTAYAQISMFLKREYTPPMYERLSYALAFGDFGNMHLDCTLTGFIIFVIFSMFTTLVLMNLLIAIMSDTYERVQSNA